MLKADRQRRILEILQQNGNVLVTDIGDQFDVSEMTIRRDLRELEQEGLLRRVHGGAITDLGRGYKPMFQVRALKNVEAKQLIGRQAAKLICPGDTIALDTGTTTLEIARGLAGSRDLTIITASLPIVAEIQASLALEADVRLILTGGILRTGEASMIGHIAERTYEDLNVEKGFIGIGGIDIKEGLTEYSLEDALVKRALLASAQLKIVVADGSKFGRVAFAFVCPLSDIDMIITDSSAPPDVLAELAALGVRIVIADELGVEEKMPP
jgi:DeoR/GlpR family transcriptional regulator of sugar metabolism